MEYNIYCDESCHLEHDRIPKMVFGCVWGPKDAVRRASKSITEAKRQHGFNFELKWNRVGRGKLDLYREVLRLFFEDPQLAFRCVVVSDKDKLDHEAFNAGSHDAFYYKMFYLAIQVIVEEIHSYNIYLDIKDTRSTSRLVTLRDILRTKFSDSEGKVIKNIQQIRSHESNLLQVCDVLIGAVAYRNRLLTSSEPKLELVKLITESAGQRLDFKSPMAARKFNVFVFNPQKA